MAFDRRLDSRCDARGVVLRDAGSCGGTFVNDHRITERVLESGDLIKLGQTILSLLVDDGESTGSRGG